MRRESVHQFLLQAQAQLRFPFWQAPNNAKPQELVQFYSGIIAADPTDDAARLQRARTYYSLGSRQAAVEDLEAVLKVEAANPEALHDLGIHAMVAWPSRTSPGGRPAIDRPGIRRV